MKKLVIVWLGGAAVITLIFGTIYATVQQSYRQSANDPQIQMAEDAAAQLNRGADPANLIKEPVDARASLAPFLIIYDRNGRLETSGAEVDGQSPVLPTGVLQTTGNGQTRFTWQPQSDIRIASVVVAATDHYILAGRSLREVEKRERVLTWMVLAGWLMALMVLTGTKLLYLKFK